MLPHRAFPEPARRGRHVRRVCQPAFASSERAGFALRAPRPPSRWAVSASHAGCGLLGTRRGTDRSTCLAQSRGLAPVASSALSAAPSFVQGGGSPARYAEPVRAADSTEQRRLPGSDRQISCGCRMKKKSVDGSARSSLKQCGGRMRRQCPCGASRRRLALVRAADKGRWPWSVPVRAGSASSPHQPRCSHRGEPPCVARASRTAPGGLHSDTGGSAAVCRPEPMTRKPFRDARRTAKATPRQEELFLQVGQGKLSGNSSRASALVREQVRPSGIRRMISPFPSCMIGGAGERRPARPAGTAWDGALKNAPVRRKHRPGPHPREGYLIGAWTFSAATGLNLPPPGSDYSPVAPTAGCPPPSTAQARTDHAPRLRAGKAVALPPCLHPPGSRLAAGRATSCRRWKPSLEVKTPALDR